MSSSSLSWGIPVDNLVRYLQATGWRRRKDYPLPNVLVFIGPPDDNGELIDCVFPSTTDARSYARDVGRVIEALSILEQRRPEEIAEEIRSLETDRLKVSLASNETARGSMPLGTAAQMLYGLRSLMVATARMEAEPAPSHRTTRKRESEFGDFCRLGQTELGSFVINIEIPILVEYDNNSSSRKVIQRIMRGLDIVTHAQAPEQLVNAYSEGMNANMLEAMLLLRPDAHNFQINIASRFTKQIPLYQSAPDNVEVRAHNFDLMEEGARQLRELDVVKVRAYRGRVRTLVSNTGQVNIDVTDKNKSYQLHSYLTGADYWNAVHAHDKKLDVIVIGKLNFHGPQRWIDEVVKFEIVQDEKAK